MAEQKNPAARKATATSAASGSAKTSRTASATVAKKPAAKISTPATEPKKTRVAATKKTESATEKKAPAKKSSAAKAGKVQPTPEERYRMVQTAAYFIAERNGFQGYPADHWLQAELEIAMQLGE